MPKVIENTSDVFAAFGVPEPGSENESVFTPSPREPVTADVEDDPEPVKPTQVLPTPPGSLRLSRGYEVKGIVFDSLVLRPPRGVDYWVHGDVYDWQFAMDGRPIRVERLDVIREYAVLSIQALPHLTSVDMIDALNIADTRALRRAVVDFFSELKGD